MALLDFDALSLFFHHYLAAELSHLDPSTPPQFTPMPSAPPDANHRPHSLRTPTRRTAITIGGTTPHGRGSAARRRADGDLPVAPKYQCLDYDPFILEDIERHKVFVDIEDFMHSVLLIPFDWRVAYAPIIKTVLANKDFQTSLHKYLATCDIQDFGEHELYDDHMEMNNHALAAIDNADPDGSSLRFVMNHDKAMAGGIFTANGGLKPDFLLLLAEFLASQFKDGKVPVDYRFEGLAWAQVLLAWEIKHLDCTLDDGLSGKRIKDRNGKDPAQTHRRPGPRGLAGSNELHTGPSTATNQSKKRKSQESNPVAKRQKVQSVVDDQTLLSIDSTLKPLEEDEVAATPATGKQSENRRKTMLQVVRYVFEKFGMSALRSHVTAGLIDRDHLQLFHANHSTLLISRAISLKEDVDLDMFIAILIGLHRMTLRQLGVMDVVDQHREFLSDSGFYGKRVTGGLKGDYKKMHSGNTMTIRKGVVGKKPIVINLDGIINREPSVIGRSTSTLYGTSDEWPGMNLVIKISFPSAGRVSEETFLTIAKEKAEEMAKDGERYWVLNHLPQLLHAETAELDEVEENVKELCTTREYVGGEKSCYDDRRRRILVYEMLQPLQTLTTARDFAQVFVDIIATHKWLYDHPKILHRDISMDNIMYRIGTDGTIYGVLNDFDLSSFLHAIGESTSVQRTGTPPFMAMDVLTGRPYHYYRHDLESIFYVMLVIASRHELRKPRKNSKNYKEKPFLPHHLIQRSIALPLAEWFDPKVTYQALARSKDLYITGEGQMLELSPTFECLRPWLKKMRNSLSRGLLKRQAHVNTLREYQEYDSDDTDGDEAPMPPPPPFDEVTLGGDVKYNNFLDPALKLKGDLTGLRYRYVQ